MKRILVLAALGLAMQSCGVSDGEVSADADTLTRAQKDSIVSELPVPGAGAVGAAMRARDAATARAEAHDSIG